MKSFLFFISIIFLFHLGYSQNDTIIYYKANHKSVLGKKDAIGFTQIKKKGDNEYKLSYSSKKGERWIKSKYTRILTVENDSMVKILNQFTRNEYYRSFKPIGTHFYIKEYYKNGKLRIEGLSKSIIYNHWEGQVKEYYPSGRLESITRYKNNQVRGNKNWLENGKPYIDNIYTDADVMPQFPGGEMKLKEYLQNNLKYPEDANNNSIQGKVFVSFVIDIDGNIIGIHVIRKLHPLFDKEAIRVVSEMPKWSIGKLEDKPVKVGFTLPINFRLQ